MRELRQRENKRDTQDSQGFLPIMRELRPEFHKLMQNFLIRFSPDYEGIETLNNIPKFAVANEFSPDYEGIETS